MSKFIIYVTYIMMDVEERKQKFREFEGWHLNNTVFNYEQPNSKNTPLEFYNWAQLEFLDPNGNYALYKVLQVLSKKELLKIPNATTAQINYKNLWAVSLQGGVASYNRVTGEIILQLTDYDDKSEWQFNLDGDVYYGVTYEFSVTTPFSGGNVGGSTLVRTLPPPGFENTNFNCLYACIYNKK